jgi:hypothetical protein
MDAIELHPSLSGSALIGAGALAFFQQGQRTVHPDEVSPEGGQEPGAVSHPAGIDEEVVGGHTIPRLS